MTQEQLAKESGVHRVTIARYETGATSPTVRSLEKIAAALNVPVSDLVDGKGEFR
jgi:transcriptional regulator with XRE-family HTH domain